MGTQNRAWPRCRVLPLPDYQIAFQVDGQERLRWHFGAQYPRPFFYPLLGPSGESLTRMGHPGAPNHDHHRSIWLGHQRVMGVDFWSDTSPAKIRQTNWLAYEDGDEAVSAVELGWYDGHDPQPLLVQRLITSVRAGPEPGETLVELESEFRPRAEQFEFGQTNYGFLAVRVAKHLSAVFGSGQLRDSEGRVGEAAIFANNARWIDYSGYAPLSGGTLEEEGVSFFDHPSNPNYPTTWHVRDDGWMGAAVCLRGGLLCGRLQPLRLRYLLWAHRGPCSPVQADKLAEWFSQLPGWSIERSTIPHRTWQLKRTPVP